MARYESAWWSAEIPSGWTAEADEACATFLRSGGALQISAARKDFGDVTDEDVAEYARDTYGSEASFLPAAFGVLRGLHHEWEEGGAARQAWLLRQGRVLLFITYYSESPALGSELSDVRQVILSPISKLPA